MSRCTGHCCRRFFLPYSPEKIEERRDTIQDGHFIADMVIHLESDDEGNHYFTCRHLVEADDGTASCGAYEDRPAMCRQYPYGNACTYAGCTMKDNEGVED